MTRTAYALDAKSRTLRAEIDLPNPDGKLHPGLYAYATIVAEEHPDALTLPDHGRRPRRRTRRTASSSDGEAGRGGRSRSA